MANQLIQSDTSRLRIPISETGSNIDRSMEMKNIESGEQETNDYWEGVSYVQSKSVQDHTKLRTFYNVGLRLITLGSALTAFVIMVTDNQTITYPFPLNGVIVYLVSAAKWEYSSAFVWFVIATAVVSVHTFFSLLLVGCMYKLSRNNVSRLSSALPWTLFILDLVMLNILMSALAAGISLSVIGEYGNTHTNWNEICNKVERFCNRAIGAQAAGVVAFLGLFQLCILDTFLLHIHTRKVR